MAIFRQIKKRTDYQVVMNMAAYKPSLFQARIRLFSAHSPNLSFPPIRCLIGGHKAQK